MKRSGCGQLSGGPTLVSDQSRSRMMAASSPSPIKRSEEDCVIAPVEPKCRTSEG